MAESVISSEEKKDVQANLDKKGEDFQTDAGEEGINVQSSLSGKKNKTNSDTGSKNANFQTNFDETKVNVQTGQFTSLASNEGGVGGQGSINMLMDLELPVAVELGRVRMYVKDILELGPGAVVELNKFSGEPVDLFVNNKKFAEGEVVVVDQNFGVRITALVGPNERLSQFNQ